MNNPNTPSSNLNTLPSRFSGFRNAIFATILLGGSCFALNEYVKSKISNTFSSLRRLGATVDKLDEALGKIDEEFSTSLFCDEKKDGCITDNICGKKVVLPKDKLLELREMLAVNGNCVTENICDKEETYPEVFRDHFIERGCPEEEEPVEEPAS